MTRETLIAMVRKVADLTDDAELAESYGQVAAMLHADGKEIERLRARVAELEASQRMRPMSEAPRDGLEILVETLHGNRHIAHHSREQNTKYVWRIADRQWWLFDLELVGWWPLPAPEDGK